MESVTLEMMIGRVREQRARWNFQMQPPCSELEIENLRRLMERQLSAPAPPRYLDLLRITNGFNENGLRVFASRTTRDLTSDVVGRELFIPGIIEANIEYRDNRDNYDQLLVFAETEAWVYAQVIETGQFIKLLHSEQEATEEYYTFDEMMIAAIGDILV